VRAWLRILTAVLTAQERAMYLLNVSYSQSPETVQPHIQPHSAWVKKYADEGLILFAGPKKSGLGGVIAVKSIEKSRLLEILSEDPYVIQDVADVQILDFDCKLAIDELTGLKGL